MIDKQSDSNGNKELSDKEAQQLAKKRAAEGMVKKFEHQVRTKTGGNEPTTIEDESWAMDHFWNFHLLWTTLLVSLGFAALITYQFYNDGEKGYRLDVFAVVFIITYPCSYISTWLATKKSFRMRSWCRKHGWTFNRSTLGSGPIGNATDLEKSRLFDSTGTSNYVMSKKFGHRNIVLSQHSRNHRSKQNTKTSTFLLMNFPGKCPDMVVHGHHMKDMIKLPGQMPTVKFESDEFNNKWTIRSDDAKAAYDRMDPSTMEYLLSVDMPLIMEFIGGLLIIQSQKDTLENRLKLMGFAEGLSKAVPDDLMPAIDVLSSDSNG